MPTPDQILSVEKLQRKLRALPAGCHIDLQIHIHDGYPVETKLQAVTPFGEKFDLWIWDGYESKTEVK